jgi:hypothetical protein
MAKKGAGGPYKALTYLHLPVIEKDFKPGDLVSTEELEEAEQDDDAIQALIEGGSLGGEDDDVHYSHIIPDAAMPTIGTVVSDAQRLVKELEALNEEIPPELQAVANLDYNQLRTDDEGKSGDTNA